MKLKTPVGAKIRYAYAMNGWEYDKEKAKEHLKHGEVYTVQRIEVGSSETRVWLVEIPNVSFNSVQFSNARIK